MYPYSENKGADQFLVFAYAGKGADLFLVFAYADCWFSHDAAHTMI